MASKVLKGLTIEIGGDTTKLGKALDGVEKQSRELSNELGQINKLLKLDPKNTELLAQKQKVLAESIGTTEEKLDTLREAEKQVQAQFEKGEASEEQVRALQREIIAAEQKLEKFRKEAEDAAKALDDLGDEADDAGDGIKDVGEESEEAEKESGGFGETLKNVLAGGLAAVAGAAVGAVAGIQSVVEETAEYRNAMSKLNTSFESNGHSAEAAYSTYSELQSILGETDQALEAASFLAKLTDNEEDLARWTQAATGVYAQFGAALPIEGLTEAANETAKVGQVTGPLADALNWAAKEGETFGVVLKEATEENEAWNTAVMEAASAEDYFNLALQECTTEQERQALILSTLEGMYSDTADSYREANKEVIAQNKATERLNKAWATIGKKAAPIVTTFTEGIAELVEAFVELIEDVDIEPFLKLIRDGFKKLTKDVLPKLLNALEWVAENFDVIKSAALGFIAALATQKVLKFATTVGVDLVKALVNGTAKQKLMNLAANANPYVLLATAIIGVATALNTYFSSRAEEATEVAETLTEAEKKLAEAADDAAESFRDQKKATEETLGGITAQMDYVSDLSDELLGLADATGKVQEKDRARVEFILNELREATGEEYLMVDGVIERYDELKDSIDQVIQSKLANALLEAANSDYVTAIQEENAALENANIKLKELEAQKQRVAEANEAQAAAEAEFNEAKMSGNTAWIDATNYSLYVADQALEKEKGILTEKETAYEDSLGAYTGYHLTILDYEAAQQAALEGNYEVVKSLLVKKSGAYAAYSDTVDEETANVLDTLFKEAIDAGIAAKHTKDNFEKGVDGFTKEMVDEAEKGYEDALEEFATAYADAEDVGEDLAGGMTAGAENKRGGLLAKARSLVSGFLAAARNEADSHSPSRKAIKLFEDIGAGAEIGVENKTKDVERAAKDQVAAVMGAYDGLRDPYGQQSLRQLAGIESARQTASQTALASTNSGVLGKILEAIERGQVITIDGDTLVGATADRMDNALGSRRVLSARGAI